MNLPVEITNDVEANELSVDMKEFVYYLLFPKISIFSLELKICIYFILLNHYTFTIPYPHSSPTLPFTIPFPPETTLINTPRPKLEPTQTLQKSHTTSNVQK